MNILNRNTTIYWSGVVITEPRLRRINKTTTKQKNKKTKLNRFSQNTRHNKCKQPECQNRGGTTTRCAEHQKQNARVNRTAMARRCIRCITAFEDKPSCLPAAWRLLTEVRAAIRKRAAPSNEGVFTLPSMSAAEGGGAKPEIMKKKNANARVIALYATTAKFITCPPL